MENLVENAYGLGKWVDMVRTRASLQRGIQGKVFMTVWQDSSSAPRTGRGVTTVDMKWPTSEGIMRLSSSYPGRWHALSLGRLVGGQKVV